MKQQHYPFQLEPLPYSYDALEPFIDQSTLHFHHDKHLQTYVDNLNKTLAPFPQLHNKTLEELLLQFRRYTGRYPYCGSKQRWWCV